MERCEVIGDSNGQIEVCKATVALGDEILIGEARPLTEAERLAVEKAFSDDGLGLGNECFDSVFGSWFRPSAPASEISKAANDSTEGEDVLGEDAGRLYLYLFTYYVRPKLQPAKARGGVKLSAKAGIVLARTDEEAKLRAEAKLNERGLSQEVKRLKRHALATTASLKANNLWSLLTQDEMLEVMGSELSTLMETIDLLDTVAANQVANQIGDVAKAIPADTIRDETWEFDSYSPRVADPNACFDSVMPI